MLCGEVHYFRVPRQLWRDRLTKLKAAGANCVSTYIPWNWHMPRENIFVFSDDNYSEWYTPRYFSRDLRGFLELAKELGLKVVARPGPYICSEWDNGGHPAWICLKTRLPRSLDPGYFSEVAKWYRIVLPIIAEYAEKNVVALLQVENEYFWGNEEYLKRLREEAEQYVKNIPIVTNENPFQRAVPNTIDDYPYPWDLARFDEKVRRYVDSQGDMIKMFMELEGGWFTSTRYGLTPTNRGGFPAEWTELLIKTAVGLGVDHFNIYMFHGGTNPSYYAGKYITTSYDYEAAIREWGELSERYYVVKRLYMLLSTISDILPEAKTAQGEYVGETSCGEVFARKGSRVALIVARNMGEYHCYQSIVSRSGKIPRNGSILLKPKTAKIILADYEISGSEIVLKYSTAELLTRAKIADTNVLILYGDVGEEVEVALHSPKHFVETRVYGAVTSENKGGDLLVRTSIKDVEELFYASTSTGGKILLVFTSKKRSGRTWLLESGSEKAILISNIYYASSEQDNGVQAEFDEESCGPITIISPRRLKSFVLSDGSAIPLEEVIPHVYVGQIHIETCRLPHAYKSEVWSAYMRFDPVDYSYKDVELGKPIEQQGFLNNGIYVYKGLVNVTSDMLKTKDNSINIVGVSDFAVVKVNGEYAGHGYHLVKARGDGLKEGVNNIEIMVESTGRPNDGLLHVPNGIYGGLYLGEKDVIYLNKWWRVEVSPPYGPEFDMSRFMHDPRKVVEILTKWEQLERMERALIDIPGLYVSKITLSNLGGRVVFDPGQAFYYNHYYRVLLFVNRRFVGPLIGPIDITEYLQQGVNEIAVFTDWGIVQPVLRIYKHVLKGEWSIQSGVKGLEEKWQKTHWEEYEYVKLPLRLNGMGGRVVWIKSTFEYRSKPGIRAAVKLRVDSAGMRLHVFVNGELVGRLDDESPTRELYIPEPILENGLNKIVLMGVVYSNHARIDRVVVKEVGVKKREKIVFI